MNIDILSSNLDLTPSLKTYVEEKLGKVSKLVQRYEEQGSAQMRVEVSRTTNHHNKGDVFRAEANLTIGGKMLRAEDENTDIRIAVDRVEDKLTQELRKLKDKELAARHSGGNK